MTFRLNEDQVSADLAPLFNDPSFRRGVWNIANDPFLLVYFLMSTSEGEGMGEAGVAAIRQDEVAALMHEMDRQEREERGHKTGTYEIARMIAPDLFDDGNYKYVSELNGKDYYLSVLNRNRERLKAAGKLSRVGLYLTTSFGYEVMVVLLYQAVIDALKESGLPETVRAPARNALQKILDEEEGHLYIVDQHAKLVCADRTHLSEQASAELEKLALLEPEDYRWCAELAVREVVQMYRSFADIEAFRRRIKRAD